MLEENCADRWMEIYLEVVDPEGNNVEEKDVEYSEVNCLRLHIPYGCLRAATYASDYFTTAEAISRFLHWTLYDNQSGQSWWPPS